MWTRSADGSLRASEGNPLYVPQYSYRNTASQRYRGLKESLGSSADWEPVLNRTVLVVTQHYDRIVKGNELERALDQATLTSVRKQRVKPRMPYSVRKANNPF
jgi:hypothetical protein